MSLRIPEEALPDEGLAEKELDVFLIPTAGWQSLQEHHNLLEIHLEQLVRPFDQKGGADIEMEMGEPLVLRLLNVSLIRTLY